MVLGEVARGDVVHRELHAEAGAVGEGQDPRVDIGQPDLEHRAALALLLDAAVLELRVVAVGQVLARGRHGHGDDMADEGDDVREAPRAVLVLSRGRHEEKEEERHRQVGDAASQVAPAGRGGVGDANDGFGEHLCAPGLRADERGKGEADETAAHDEAYSIRREHHPDDAGRADRHKNEHALAGAEDVHHGAHDCAEYDGAGHAGDLAAGDVCLRQVQRVLLLHVRTERRRCEGAHEACEEVEPRGVEGAHVRLGEREDIDGRGLVLSVNRQRELTVVDILVTARVDRAAATPHDVVHRIHLHPEGRKFLLLFRRHETRSP
mmetsp:Transcript_15325/g.36264  ORF Transcript_15325/g.36264 Transcript_15325/m.36264 type:complete len:322 (-) Transcript_15325:21-986(-)